MEELTKIIERMMNNNENISISGESSVIVNGKSFDVSHILEAESSMSFKWAAIQSLIDHDETYRKLANE